MRTRTERHDISRPGALLLLLLTAVLCCAAPAGTRAAPPEPAYPAGLRAEGDTEHDFGEIPRGEVRTAEFALRCDAATAVIVSASTNCQCTRADYPKKPLTAGDRALVKVRYEARDEGFFRKVVTLNAIADGKPAALRFVVTGNVAGTPAEGKRP